ncbi:hypothetical protein B7P43_G07538 [Cryptotermes secundus]|uniref:BLUF domain-containing protein n=1 Tax=Cryptotermes secundus TaxID=105785 RepID=A0A2J7QI13_9NEOP|nr:hypothetical protein B7P43_G07538 [Cryptotermes secundus]
MFPAVLPLADGNKVVMNTIKEHLEMLQQKFNKYFGESVQDFDWVRDPFVANSEYLPINIQEEIADLKADRTLKLKLLEVPLDTFVTYLHRITYVGEHSFRDDPTVKQLYEEIIRDMNSEDPDEILTGFLLCYDEFFVHILEGSEEMILRHLHRIYALVDGGEARLGTMKLLIACHNVRQRFYKQWAARTTRPPTLLQDIDPACEAETTWRHVRTCITKLHQLSKFLSQRTGVALKTVIDRLSETVPTCLPESVLLNFVLQCKSLPNLRKYMNAHCTISTSESYQGKYSTVSACICQAPSLRQ